MPTFVSEGLEIAYEVFGHGAPVMLVHGFGSNLRVNWVDTGWVETITSAGYQAIALDNRGHGGSEKLYDPALYPTRLMGHDAINLLDHLGICRAAFIGYSMGARVCAFAAIDAPERVAAAVFGGMGANMMRGLDTSPEIVAALLADRLEDVTGRIGRQYRIFAEHTKSDRQALAACMQSGREAIAEDVFRTMRVPVLVAIGSEDDVSGPAEPLAELIPKGETLIIPRRDHMRATGDRVFKEGVLDFLGRIPW
jgi:pimeloyl-ACP methyl ester carboxylesterase